MWLSALKGSVLELGSPSLVLLACSFAMRCEPASMREARIVTLSSCDHLRSVLVAGADSGRDFGIAPLRALSNSTCFLLLPRVWPRPDLCETAPPFLLTSSTTPHERSR